MKMGFFITGLPRAFGMSLFTWLFRNGDVRSTSKTQLTRKTLWCNSVPRNRYKNVLNVHLSVVECLSCLQLGWGHDSEHHSWSLPSWSLKSSKGVTDKSINPQVEFITHTIKDAEVPQFRLSLRQGQDKYSLHGKEVFVIWMKGWLSCERAKMGEWKEQHGQGWEGWRTQGPGYCAAWGRARYVQWVKGIPEKAWWWGGEGGGTAADNHNDTGALLPCLNTHYSLHL